MAGLVPAIHVFSCGTFKFVDARHKAGHDESKIEATADDGARQALSWASAVDWPNALTR
jgi:hypothetical protein